MINLHLHPVHSVAIRHGLASLSPGRCNTAIYGQDALRSTVYSPPSRWRPCARRATDADALDAHGAPVIWRKLLPADRQRVLSPLQRNGLLDHLQTCGVSLLFIRYLFYFFANVYLCGAASFVGGAGDGGCLVRWGIDRRSHHHPFPRKMCQAIPIRLCKENHMQV